MHRYQFMTSFYSNKTCAAIHLVFEVSVLVPELSEWLELLQNFSHVTFLRNDCF